VVFRRIHLSIRVCAALLCCLGLAAPALAATVYKWTDESGTVHLSTSKPPAGVHFETVTVASSSGSGTVSRPGSTKGGPAPRTQANPAQAAERSEVLASLRNRECVIALEALDRLTSGTQPTSADEIRRLKQTTDANCSSEPARRRQQEEMAAQLRVANGPECVKARNELADMMSGKTVVSADRKRAQQAFVDAHCVPPVQ
jgi:hypothetical protein